MLRTILLGAGALTLAAVSPAPLDAAAGAPPAPWNEDGAHDPFEAGITVTGRGSTVVAPDQVSVRLLVQGAGPTPEKAHGAYAERRAALAQVLEGLGGPETRSLGVALRPGFEVEERVVVTLRAVEGKLDNVLTLIGRAQDAAAARLPGARDGDDDTVLYFAGEAATREARERAVAAAVDDARVRAQAIATAAGVKLGAVDAIRVVEPFGATSTSSGRQERSIGLQVRYRLAY